ncbi:MAG: alpha/beta fold hydrolase [Burkholderiales bacterium]|nr:MAG: alpha/beta fold hydrolase [Burkholderiales bacterium]
MKRLLLSILLALLVGGAAWLWTPDRDRAALEARWLASPADLVDIAGTRLHVRDEGPRDAPAVLLLHGFGSSLHTWDTWATALRERHRVLRIDLPGHGLSGPDATGDYGDARSLALLVALLDARGLSRVTLVGHSIGGRIAWRFAAEHPDRIERLVLVAPDGFASPGFEYGRAPEVPTVLTAMRWVLPRAALKANLEPAFADPAMLDDALLTRYHELMLAPGNREALLHRMRQTVLEDPVPRLATIRVPVLLVWGERDAMIPVSNAGDYLRALPDATLERLPGVGHLPQEEAAQASAGALVRWLARTAPR